MSRTGLQRENSNSFDFSTLPWSNKSGTVEPSGSTNPVPSFSLHKTRSSPSIFAMTAKSSGFPVDYHNTDLVASQLQHNTNGNTETSRSNSSVASSSYRPALEESPSVLRRSLTMQYDYCDWKKSSTMPHDYNRSGSQRNHHFFKSYIEY